MKYMITIGRNYFKGFYNHQGQTYVAHESIDKDNIKYYKTKKGAEKMANRLKNEYSHILDDKIRVVEVS